MNNLERRIDRLEESLGMKPEPRVRIITSVRPNLGPPLPGTDKETPCPCTVEILAGLWAYAVRGGPFTDEEIRELREEHEGGNKG